MSPTDTVPTAVPTVRLRLQQLLKERFDPIPVLYGEEADLAHETVIVDGLLSDGTQQVVLLGAQTHDEQFMLGIRLIAGKVGQSPQAAYERAYQLLAVLSAVLLDDASLGLGFYVQARLAQFAENPGELVTSEGARCDLLAGVLVNARLKGR